MNTSQRHKRFHKFFTILAITISAIAMAMIIWFLIVYNNNEETNDAQIDQYITPIAMRISGYITEVRFNENQFVKKGDTLIVIDDREYKANLGMAVADVNNATQNSHLAQNNVATVHSDIAVQKSQLQAAKSTLWQTKQDYKRFQALFDEEAATEQQLELMQNHYESALAHYQELLNILKSTKLSTAEALSKIPLTESTIEGKKAAVEKAALYLSYTVIIAPYDGWIGKRTIQPGQLVKEGQTLCSIVSKEKWVTANFKETQIGQITLGQEVSFEADAGDGTEFHGIISSFSPASGSRFSLLPPDNATGNFVKIEQRIPVRITLTDSEEKTNFLRAGMSVTVTGPHQN